MLNQVVDVVLVNRALIRSPALLRWGSVEADDLNLDAKIRSWISRFVWFHFSPLNRIGWEMQASRSVLDAAGCGELRLQRSFLNLTPL
jgi:hypothetical protein